MNPRAALWFAFGASLALLACASCAGPQVRENGAPVNFVQVRPDVFRSGQPVGDEWQRLNIRHVIKLNFDDEGDESGAEAAGIEVHRVPIQPSTKGIDIFTPPSRDAMATLRGLADRILYARGGEGAWLIHCQNGHDRTGLVVALVRMVVDGWTPERAWDEMIARGYHPQLVGLNHAFREFSEGMEAR